MSYDQDMVFSSCEHVVRMSMGELHSVAELVIPRREINRTEGGMVQGDWLENRKEPHGMDREQTQTPDKVSLVFP